MSIFPLLCLNKPCRLTHYSFNIANISYAPVLRVHPLSVSLPAGSKESLLSATISASEEVMTILEEVIMYTFQQCVYYITKVKKKTALSRCRRLW